MQSFSDFLREKGGIYEKRIPYYKVWSDMYERYIKRSENKEQSIKEFESFLESKYQDWQVKQAKEAIQLYTYYRNRTNKKIECIQMRKEIDLPRAESLNWISIEEYIIQAVDLFAFKEKIIAQHCDLK
jgi:hypothetical protein